jgi:hypothetical protein
VVIIEWLEQWGNREQEERKVCRKNEKRKEKKRKSWERERKVKQESAEQIDNWREWKMVIGNNKLEKIKIKAKI